MTPLDTFVSAIMDRVERRRRLKPRVRITVIRESQAEIIGADDDHVIGVLTALISPTAAAGGERR